MTAPDYGEIILDDTRFKLAADPTVNAVDRFPGKITIGDYGLDSDDLLSSWVLSDLTGGHGVADLQEGTDTNRYRWGNLNTRYPKQWAAPFRRYGEVVGTGAVYPLGDMNDNGTQTRYAVVGTHLYSDVPVGTTTAWTDQGALSGVPTDKGVAYAGLGARVLLYVPQGAHGYSTFADFPSLNNQSGAELMQSFCLWDDKLIGIDTAGQIYYATEAIDNAVTVFTSYGVSGKLDPSFTPKHLIVYYNRAGEPSIYVVTNQNVWVFDPATPRLYLVPDLGSPNPYFGAAVCTWRGLLYISSGMDILEFNGNVIRNIGLSRDDGPSDKHSMPYQYLGSVVDLVPSQNSLYAYVKGADTGGGFFYSSMQEYSGFGWCVDWLSATSTLGPSWAAMTRAGGGYALWWGDLGYTATNANTGFQPLPTNNTNPREALDSGAYLFGVGGTGIAAETYSLDTGWFDANMPGYAKIASAVTITLRGSGDTDARLYYRLDDATSFTFLANVGIVGGGSTVVSLGTTDANGVSTGLLFKRMELRVVLDPLGTDNGQVVVESVILTFLKLQNPSLSWTIQLDLSSTHNELSPAQMRAKLTSLRTSGAFFALLHLGTTYRVRLSGVGGTEHSGEDYRGRVTISVIEIPQEGGVGGDVEIA